MLNSVAFKKYNEGFADGWLKCKRQWDQVVLQEQGTNNPGRRPKQNNCCLWCCLGGFLLHEHQLLCTMYGMSSWDLTFVCDMGSADVCACVYVCTGFAPYLDGVRKSYLDAVRGVRTRSDPGFGPANQPNPGANRTIASSHAGPNNNGLFSGHQFMARIACACWHCLCMLTRQWHNDMVILRAWSSYRCSRHPRGTGAHHQWRTGGWRGSEAWRSGFLSATRDGAAQGALPLKL